jgi:hypothetical protein
MAHKVKFGIPQGELGNANLEFLVYRDGAVFGKLLVSKGAVVWRKKWKSKRGKKLGWNQFAKIMQECGHSIKGG